MTLPTLSLCTTRECYRIALDKHVFRQVIVLNGVARRPRRSIWKHFHPLRIHNVPYGGSPYKNRHAYDAFASHACCIEYTSKVFKHQLRLLRRIIRKRARLPIQSIDTTSHNERADTRGCGDGLLSMAEPNDIDAASDEHLFSFRETRRAKPQTRLLSLFRPACDIAVDTRTKSAGCLRAHQRSAPSSKSQKNRSSGHPLV